MSLVIEQLKEDVLELFKKLLNHKVDNLLMSKTLQVSIDRKTFEAESFSIPLKVDGWHFIVAESAFCESPLKGISYCKLSFRYQVYPEDIFYNPKMGIYSPSSIFLGEFEIQHISIWEEHIVFEDEKLKDKKLEEIKFDSVILFEDRKNQKSIAFRGEKMPMNRIECTFDTKTIKKWLKGVRKRWETSK